MTKKGTSIGKIGTSDGRTPPGRMVRKQILLTSGQNRWLKRRAEETGLAESEIIRGALEREAGMEAPAASWREQLSSLVGSIRDEEYAKRVAENKARQGEAWRKRLARTSDALGD